MKINLSIIGITSFFLLNCIIFGAVTPISPTDLENAITKHTLNYDFFLIDVRDYTEVEYGIIASKYCKPYHLSLNSGELDRNVLLLPKSARIIVYCQAGYRSGEAAIKLADAGYELVGPISGGLGAYTGKLADSTEFKPLSKLPEASYFETTTISRDNPRFNIVIPTNETRRQFTLQGRIIPQVRRQQNPPIYILERIGDDTYGKIIGLHRLVLELE